MGAMLIHAGRQTDWWEWRRVIDAVRDHSDAPKEENSKVKTSGALAEIWTGTFLNKRNVAAWATFLATSLLTLQTPN